MQFSVAINKWANFYFFVQNLSEWHFSNRKRYNVLWAREVGPFSTAAKRSLQRFKTLHRRYPFGQDFFGQTFLLSESPLAHLKKVLRKGDFKTLQEVFSTFTPYFELLWTKDLPRLEQWRRTLQTRLRGAGSMDLNLALASLYHVQPLRRDIIVYLVFSAPDCNGGSANMDGKSVTLEISRYPFKLVNQAVGIVWHELIHLYFEQGYFLGLLSKTFSRDQKTVDLIKEAAASSLLPNGVLGRSLLRIKAAMLSTQIPTRHNAYLLRLAKRYATNKKAFDEEYIRAMRYFLKRDVMVQ